MSEKVKLPKVVSEAMNRVFHSNESFMKEKHFHEIMQIKIETQCTQDQKIIYNYFYGHGWLILAESLIKGYEADQTPEDKVREMYELHFDDGERSPYETGYNEGVQFGVKQTLDILGLKIDGVYT